MPKQAKMMSAYQIARLRSEGMHAVGGVAGLVLRIRKTEDGDGLQRYWMCRLMLNGERVARGIGTYPEISLEDARAAAKVMRKLAREGKDPRQVQEAETQAAKAEAAKRITFEEIARQCWAAKSPEFKNDKHRQQWIGTLEKYAFETLGQLHVQDVVRPLVLKVLQPIWEPLTDTATKVRGRIEAVIDYAKASGAYTGENPAQWKELKPLLPSPTKLIKRKKKHHAALPWQRMHEFMTLLRQEEGTAARCTEACIHIAARSIEIRSLMWDWIDWEDMVIKFPPSIMKGELLHRVPITDAAARILRSMPRLEGSPYVFGSPDNDGKILSDNTLLEVVKRIVEKMPGKPPATPHGFRSCFKDWARSQPGHDDDATELAIAHVNSDKTRAAYARDELLPKRTVIMNDWSKFCATPRAASNVVQLRPVASDAPA